MSVAFPFLWQVNANGFVSAQPSGNGNMNLTFADDPTIDDSFTFTGTLELAGDASNLMGSWDGVAKVITFTRDIGGGTTQTYTGFLGDHDPGNLMLGGSFTESDIPGGSPRAQFGWCAQEVTPIS